jgi:DNA-binding PadR family transcriptional regulator
MIDEGHDMLNNEIRKGFLKFIVLKMIRDHPSHGYDIIHEIEKKSRGNWIPSPGSVYPVLEYLETKGYISMEEVERKKVYTVTEKGEKVLELMKEKRRQIMQEMTTFLGDILEE